jgi:uncharacterized protein YkwD
MLIGLLVAVVRGEPAAEALRRVPKSEFAAALLAETNRVRAEHGRRALQGHPDLDAAADDQAAFMALTLSSGHTSPLRGQETPAARVKRYGHAPLRVAENVARYPADEDMFGAGPAALAAALVAQWFASAGHREALLGRDFTHLGGAVRLARMPGGRWHAFGAQVFTTKL